MSTARSKGLRYSHAVIGLASLHQLIGAEWMKAPWKFDRASELEKWLFECHEIVGLVAGAALLLLGYSLWTRYGAGLRAHFLPWLDAPGRARLFSQARDAVGGLLSRSPPASDRVGVLAASWEGLGLLSMVWLALTGVAMVLSEDTLTRMHDIGELHELGALPLQLYLWGHVGMALLHEWRGEGLLRRMWSPR